MSDKKISALSSITNAELASNDVMPIVDTSAGSAGTKKIAISEFDLRWLTKDSGNNVSANNFIASIQSTAAAGGTTTLTSSSAAIQRLTGTLSQTFKLPNATTLTNGWSFTFENDSTTGSGNILYIVDSTTGSINISPIPSGGRATVILVSNSTAAGTWTCNVYVPSYVAFGNISLDINAGVHITPIGSEWLKILSPLGQASPVLEFKSNGTQVAYVSDLGNAFFQQVYANAGVSTNSLGPNSGSDISVTANLIPTSDNAYDLGSSGNTWKSVFAHNIFPIEQVSLTNTAELRLNNPGVSGTNISWQGNGHLVRWVMSATDSGGDQTWIWPGSVPGSNGGMLLVDPGITPATIYWKALTGSASDVFRGDGTFGSAAFPNFTQVLSAGNAAGGYNLNDTGTIVPLSDFSYDLGQSSLRYRDAFFVLTHTDYIQPPSGELNIGASTSDTIRFTAGDNGGTPSNQVTPSSWIHVRNNGGTDGYLPFYT